MGQGVKGAAWGCHAHLRDVNALLLLQGLLDSLELARARETWVGIGEEKGGVKNTALPPRVGRGREGGEGTHVRRRLKVHGQRAAREGLDFQLHSLWRVAVLRVDKVVCRW